MKFGFLWPEIKPPPSHGILKIGWNSRGGFVYEYATMKKLPVVILTPLVTLLFWPSAARAQSQAAAQENEAAYNLLSNADYKGAAAAYQGIITGYPTDILVQSATIQLGSANSTWAISTRLLPVSKNPKPVQRSRPTRFR
jgi:hypothetical protein